MANNDRYWYRMKISEEMESEVILISSRRLNASELEKRAERCRVKGETTFLGVRIEPRGGASRHEQKKVNCQEPLRASCTKA